MKLHIRAIAAAVTVLAAISWTAPDAYAQRRKKVQESVQTPSAEAQPRRISMTLSLAELRDSIDAEGTRRYAETMAELRDSDLVARDRLIARMSELTKFRSVYEPSSGSYLGDLAADIAKEHLGKPYVWGAEGPSSFDCSGFMMYVYRQVGVKLPRTSREQFKVGESIDIPDLKKGDLVFWSGPRGSIGATIGHVGMIVDVDYERGYFSFIHANSTSKGVSISRSDERYFLLHYKGARRIIPLDK